VKTAIPRDAGTGRRTVLKFGAAGLLASALPATAGTTVAAAPPVPVAIGRGLYLVDGWLLTEADLVHLGLDDP
jgi:hypothetical protein